MAEMIVLKCNTGSKAATVLCPSCARISRQILKAAFNNSSNNELITAHTCPVCGEIYQVCNSFGADAWRAAFLRYTMNADSYNEEVRENHNRKKKTDIDIQQTTESETTSTPKTDKMTETNSEYMFQSNLDSKSVHEQTMDNQRSVFETTHGQEIEKNKKETQPYIDEVFDEIINSLEEEEIDEEKPEIDITNTQYEEVVSPQTTLERKMDRWKKELLDTGKRNKMINYRESKRQTLKILEPSATELFNQLALGEKTLTFQRPISKDSDFRTYALLALLETFSHSLPVHVGDIKAEGTVMEREKTLKNLRAKTKLAQEEQGTNILYLSFGFIMWRENNKESSPWLKSPLLMMPVQLGIKSLSAPYTLSKYDDEIEVNPTLDYLFNQDYGIDLPTFELKNKDSFENYLGQIEEIIDKKGWKLVREVSLGLLSFLKISMYRDLNENRDMMVKNPIIQAISGNIQSLGKLPSETNNYNFDNTQPTEWHEVVDSDSSQEEAILLSKLGVSFIMQGPPGTGKSQTITNIIAQALGDGKKVLFVSEKSAALQVVLKRLTEVRLDDFCLSLHNYKANKKETIENIGSNLNLEQGYIDDTVKSELTELVHDRQYLDKYANELHKVIEPLGESAYSVLGKLSELSEATVIDFKIEEPTKISKERFLAILYLVDAFEKALGNLGGKLSDNPWADTSATSAGQIFKTEMMSSTEGLCNLLEELDKSIVSLNDRYGTSLQTTWADCRESLEELKIILELPLFPVEWRNAELRNTLRERALWEEKIDREEQIHADRLKEIDRRIKDTWDSDKLFVPVNSVCERFNDVGLWNGDRLEETVSDYCVITIDQLDSSIGEIERIADNYDKAHLLLSIKQKDYPLSILMTCHILQALQDAPKMDEDWFDIRNNPELQALIAEAKDHRDTINQKADILLKDWEPGILEIDAKGMLARFKTEYSGVFHKLKGNYKEDIKNLKLLSKKVGIQIDENEVITLLQEIEEINKEKRWFTDNENKLKKISRRHYKGLNTDWDKISLGIDRATVIAKQFPYANIPVEVIKAIGEIEDSIQLSAEVRKFADSLREESVKECFEVLQNTGMIDDLNTEISLSEDILLAVKERVKNEKERFELIKSIDNARIERNVSFADLKELISDTETIDQEIKWFIDFIPEVSDVLDIEEAQDNGLINRKLSYIDIILKNHNAIAEKNEKDRLSTLFGRRYTGNNTDWQAIVNDLNLLDQFEKRDISEKYNGFIQIVSDDPEKRENAGIMIFRIDELINQLDSKFEYFDNLFPKSNMHNIQLHEVASKYNNCLSSFDELNKWLDYVETKNDCDKNGLSNFTDMISARDNTVRDVRKAFERGFYTQWFILAIKGVPSVQGFRRRVHEQKLESFIKMDERQFVHARERIRNRIISSFPDKYAITSAKSELGILKHELSKKKRIMPLRRLFHEIPDLLLTLKPCLMMSPLSVAYFLNANDYHFDMVIFDEASQIFPQDAIGAIFRADQAIIAGDTRQLPPTNFFSSSTSNANDDYDDDNEDDFEDEIYDSILEETANVLPNRTLLWHYRSKHEHLIAFSNQEIYRNELVTFPSSNESEPDTGVEFVYVEDGYYEGGGKNCNVLEAKKCVELIKDHIDRYPNRSLGVIAFSEKQQQAISLEIQRFREQNSAYEDFFVEDKEDAFFVKNLENVQGDERDTIFFSVGYAKTKEQKASGKPMAMRFGPLGTAGGERRLNVAITRAKTNVKLVSSILPSDIDLSKTKSEGIRMLRSYIEFAMNGGATLASSNRSQASDEFVDSVCKYICDKGYKARQYVGCSEYRIDIAVEHPEIKDEFVAGIECDGRSYSSAKTARDRDRLRGSVLKNMGWNMYRVWSTEWYKNPSTECNKLIDFIDKAIKKSNVRLQAVQKQREEEEKKRNEREEQVKLGRIVEELKKAAEEKKQTRRSKTIETSEGASSNRGSQMFWKSWRSKIIETSEGASINIKTENKKTESGSDIKRDNSVQLTLDDLYRNTNNDQNDLYDELVSSGFNCIDNRFSSSIIWVLYDPEKKVRFETILAKYNEEYKLEKRGAMATNGKAAWRIMAQKEA